MAETLDLTTDIAEALDSAAARGRAPVLGYVDEQGNSSISFRGSTHVHGPAQLAVWARKQDEGLAAAVARHPRVSVVYFSPDGPGPRHVLLTGRARVDPSANDRVYETMFAAERDYDAERNGVAVIIDVDSVQGRRDSGHFEMRRDGA